MQIASDRMSARHTRVLVRNTVLPKYPFSDRQRGGDQQTTLANSIHCVGTSLHFGENVALTLHPAAPNHGIVFRRVDLPNRPLIAARYDRVIDTRLSTVLGMANDAQARVATIEHLMAALHANGIDNALIDVDNLEVPVFDGSAAAFDFLIQCAGKIRQSALRRRVEILRPVRVEGHDGAFAEILPADQGLTLALGIDFQATAIGFQSYEMVLSEVDFRRKIAFCRTFIERGDIDELHKNGLALGGSLKNAIVVDGAAILNPSGLRCPDEFVRHKLLDAVGDLYLAGHSFDGYFRGFKSGHSLNNALLHAVFADRSNWRYVSEGVNAQPLLEAVA